MRKLLLVSVLLIILGASVCAENRWVVGVKSGAGAGFIGLEGEKEWSGFSVWLASGISTGAIGYGLGLRWYFSAAPVNRAFAEIIVGGVASTGGGYDISLPYVGLGGGYEWRLFPYLRIAIEAALGFVLFIPLPILGLSMGWVF